MTEHTRRARQRRRREACRTRRRKAKAPTAGSAADESRNERNRRRRLDKYWPNALTGPYGCWSYCGESELGPLKSPATPPCCLTGSIMRLKFVQI